MTYLEIYNDTLKDLIANSAEDLAVRQVESVFKVMGLREERAFTGGPRPSPATTCRSCEACARLGD